MVDLKERLKDIGLKAGYIDAICNEGNYYIKKEFKDVMEEAQKYL